MYYCLSIRKRRKNLFIFLIFLGLLVVGCTSGEVSRGTSGDIPTLTLAGQLIPYSTVTRTPVLALEVADQTATPNPTDIPPPTSTPVVYQVVENDTLTGIALRHSVALEDLIAANPGIDPNFLTIGLTLTIPLGGVVSAALPTATPIPIIIQPPVCYSLAEGRLQCISGIENDQDYTVENVIAMISLQSPAGEDSVLQVAIPPLNILPAGEKTAVAATFSPQLPSDYVAHASLLSVIPVSSDDQRYLETELEIRKIAISSDGQQANVEGVVALLSEQPVAGAVWVSALAYDAQNNIVGIRKWVADDNVLSSGAKISFDFIVYSLGPSIEYVTILTETRP